MPSRARAVRPSTRLSSRHFSEPPLAQRCSVVGSHGWESGEDEAALPPRFPGGRPRLCPPRGGGRGRHRLRTGRRALALRPDRRALTRSPPAAHGGLGTGERPPSLRRRRAAAHVTGSGGGGAGSPGAAAGAGGGAPRPRAARDSCAELVRGEGRLEGAAGARSALASARAGAAGRERAGACMTGPAVPPGPGVQAGGTWGVHPRGVTVYPVIWGCVSVRQRKIRET